MNTKPLSEWTLAEVMAECDKHRICNAECPAYRSSDESLARLPSGAVKLSESGRCVFLDLNCNLYPSLKPGKSATLYEIIGGAK